MGLATRVINGIEYEIVFDGRQSLTDAAFGSSLGPAWCGGEREHGRGCMKGWHQLTQAQRARIARHLRGEE